MSSYRIGHGYDVHKLVKDRKLIIGGVEIPHDTGLLGHSDADVLLHAIMDALLGAMGLGDIGRHFPDSDEQYRGISSMCLLSQVSKIMREAGAELLNLDSTLILQKPKVAPYIEKMRENIAFALNAKADQINVKATTEEKLGFTGSGEGAAAHAVVILEIK